MKISRILAPKQLILAAFASLAFFGLSTVAKADVTGDFQLTSATYGTGSTANYTFVQGDGYGGDVAISGTVNNGAIQSGKSVVVNVSYEYSFQYQLGVDESANITVYCPNENANSDSCKDQRKKDTDVERVITTTVTVIKTFDVSGMTAITEPTIDPVRGRLNPKGKITGYDWSFETSVVPASVIPDPNLIPEGGVLVEGSIEITGVTYTAYLKDKNDLQIADTVVTGILF